MKRTSLLALVSLFLTGCARPTAPGIALDDSTLVNVLAELHLADARARLPDAEPGLRDSVLAFYGVDSLDFRRTMDGFVDRPDELIALYSRVMDQLNAARAP